MAVVASATGAAVFGLSGVAAGLAGGALLGAGIGGLYSAFTGDGDILNSMLTGGLIGGAAGGIGAAAFPAVTAPSTLAAAPLSTAAVPTANVATTTAAQMAAMTPAQAAAMTPAQLNAVAASQGVLAEGAAALPGAGLSAAPNVITPAMVEAGKTAAGPSAMKMLGYGLAGTSAMQLLGGKGKGAGAPASATDPGMIRPFDYTSTPNEPTGNYPSPYATASYDVAGNPIMDTRERNYFDQNFAAMQPYSAKTGTVNPNIPLPSSSPVNAANGGIMRNYDDETGRDDVASDQGNMQKGLFGLGYAHGGVARFADKGAVNEDDGESYKDRIRRLKNMNEMLKDTESSSRISMPGIEYMPDTYVPREPSRVRFNASPQGFVDNPQMKGVMGRAGANYALDRDTTLMAGLSGFAGKDRGEMTVKPSAMDVGVARKVGPGYLSGQYQRSLTGQAPARYMANYAIPMAQGGQVPRYGFGGLADSIFAQLIAQDQENSIPKYSYDQIAQRYNQVSGGNPQGLEGMPKFNYDAKDQKYTQMAQGGAADLGDYSDGGRLLKGPGDGVSDSIPATIANKQPARLADGEFVIPARIVSEIGNGSTDAGAKRLYAMMDKIQAGRKKTIGKKNVAKDTKAKKHLIA